MKIETFDAPSWHVHSLKRLISEKLEILFRHRAHWDAQQATETLDAAERHILALYEHASRLEKGPQPIYLEPAEERE